MAVQQAVFPSCLSPGHHVYHRMHQRNCCCYSGHQLGLAGSGDVTDDCLVRVVFSAEIVNILCCRMRRLNIFSSALLD
ncbi:hypothetical protein E2C01_026831 [Portunus trituberculatus]|uniref:Uncharacterized protein n=1 Tax=Portunus trituberculatus TaxID=210409 RepID=A0A5B7EGC2_PORTR|nr:hypothetical protein [Portunus trituberculatus]